VLRSRGAAARRFTGYDDGGVDRSVRKANGVDFTREVRTRVKTSTPLFTLLSRFAASHAALRRLYAVIYMSPRMSVAPSGTREKGKPRECKKNIQLPGYAFQSF
jgi:hypothetical protein